MTVTTRTLEAADWAQVVAICREGIETGDATFERAVPTWEAWNSSRHAECRIVARRGDTVMGFAAVTPVSARAVYAGIFPENVASIAVHRSVGFRVVGTWERLGRFHDGRWRDVVLMERRSPRAGVE